MAMEIASCTGSFLGRPSSSRIPSSSKAIASCRPYASLHPQTLGISTSFLSNSPLSFPPFQLNRALDGFLACCAVEGKSSASTSDVSVSKGLESSETTASSDVSAEAEKDDSQSRKQQELGKALSQIRKERVAAGQEDPSRTEEFWSGVLEEIRLIEWPPIQKVFGTTGVVLGIIVGSSLVLLTVNALLAQLSDTFFHNAPPV